MLKIGEIECQDQKTTIEYCVYGKDGILNLHDEYVNKLFIIDNE